MDQQEMNQQEMNQPQAELKVEIVQPKKSGMATAALVLGIIGVCLSFIPIVNNAAFVLGILAAIFGIVALVKKVGKAKALTGLSLGILAIVITLVMQAAMLHAVDEAINDLSGGNTDEILAESLDVQFGSFQIIKGEYFDDCKLEVTVKNKSDEQASFNVTVEAVGPDGTRIDTDYIFVTDLGAGQSQKFEIFTLVTSDQYAAMEQANFRVVEASMY